MNYINHVQIPYTSVMRKSNVIAGSFRMGLGMNEASDLRADNVAICPVRGATMATQGQALHQNHELNPSDLFMH